MKTEGHLKCSFNFCYVKAYIYERNGEFLREYVLRLESKSKLTLRVILDAFKLHFYCSIENATLYNNLLICLREPIGIVLFEMPNTKKEWDGLYSTMKHILDLENFYVS